MYLLLEQELRDLAEGKIKVEDLITPDKVALITWSGEDVKEELKKRNKSLKELELIVDRTKHNLGHCDCAMCFESALDDAIDRV